MKRESLSGTVQISRASGGTIDHTPIHIEIQDEISHCRVLDIYMSFEEFAKALTSSIGKADIRHFPDSPIGMRAESKTEIVPFESGYPAAESDITKALKPFEVDGWKARRSDMTNHHHRVSGGQKVVFFRHVNPKTGEPV